MKSTPIISALALSLLLPSVAAVFGQSVVDFREVIRTAEPALLTVVSSPNVDEAVDPGAADAQEEDAADPLADQNRPERELQGAQGDTAPDVGPRIEWVDPNRGLDANDPARFFDGLAQRPSEAISTGFAIDETTIIAYVPDSSESVSIENSKGDRSSGKVIAKDNVTGLAAIRVDEALFASLIVGTASTEPGLPVVALWIDDDVMTATSGIVASHPIASGSGIGMTPRIDLGSNRPLAGAPLLDGQGTVVGVFVPGQAGNLVCAPSGLVLRLIEAAASDPPRDLKRGLVGIQFQGGGPLVLEVSPNSGAQQAGILAGDLVEQVGAYDVRDADDVVAAVASSRAGDSLEFRLRRGEESLVLPVVLGEHPQQRLARSDGPADAWQQRGFRLDNGQIIPLDPLPDQGFFPPGMDRFPMDEFFRRFQNPNRRPFPRLTPRRNDQGDPAQ